MSSILYFAMCSSLSTSQDLPDYAKRIVNGDFRGAIQYLSALQDKPDSGLEESDAIPLCALADVKLMTGECDEAEESFRRAQKVMRNDKDRIRIASCRNTGWQALLVSRFSAALNCFLRNAEDHNTPIADRVEASVGMAITYYQLGQQAAAGNALQYANDLAKHLADTRWLLLLECLFLDFVTHSHIRASGNLRDHAFWHSSPGTFGSAQTATDCMQQSASLARKLDGMPLLSARVSYLPKLLALSEGKRSAYDDALSHAGWARNQKFSEYARGVSLEISMATLAAGFADLAAKAADASRDRIKGAMASRWNIDQLYCLAKIRQQQGNVEEAHSLYHRYALDAIQCLRTETNATKPLRGESRTEAMTPTDDVGARLPAKYRRAYRYITSNIERSTLSIQEVASHIGVTGRALQLVFKEHLGLSPSEVIRRIRMEGIREDLLENASFSDGILRTAARWGVNSRSTLISSYRKQFSETPSETLQRS